MAYFWKVAFISVSISASQSAGYAPLPPPARRRPSPQHTPKLGIVIDQQPCIYSLRLRRRRRNQISFLQQTSTKGDTDQEKTTSLQQTSAVRQEDDNDINDNDQDQDTTADADQLLAETPTQTKKSSKLEERTRRLMQGRPAATNSSTSSDSNDNPQNRKWPRDEYYKEAQALMIIWSYRQSRKGAALVERIIRRVIHTTQDGDEQRGGLDALERQSSIKLGTMYTCAIRAWTFSGERGSAERAEEILDTMQQCYSEWGIQGIKPSIEAFNMVLLAYARSGLRDAPQQALRLLAKLHDWYTAGATDVAPNKKSYAAVLRAFANTGKPDAAQRVKGLLEHLEKLAVTEGYEEVRPDYMCHGAYFSALHDAMEKDFLTGEEAATKAEAYLFYLLACHEEDVRPDAWIFNLVLGAWSKSYADDMVERADAIMELFEAYHEQSGFSEKTRPSTLSYNFLLATYSRSKLKDKGTRSLAALRRMQRGPNPAAKPDVVSFNTVMTAFGKSRQPNAPYYVEDLLREMHKEYHKTRDPRLIPTSRTYNNVVNAWAQSALPGSPSRIMDWIVHMQSNAESEGRRSLGPNKWTFNAFLQSLARSGEPSIGEDAEAVLKQMMEYYRKGWTELKPDVLTFTTAIHCIAVSGKPDALERSLAIVRRMEDFHEQGFGDVRPNCYTYNCVINAAAKSHRPGKAQIALQLLRRMQEVALRPPTVSYNNVLNACAFANHRDDVADDILRIAKEVFEEAKVECEPNYITYGAYIRVISKFVRDGTMKKNLVFDVYRQCCEAGQLTNHVMKQLRYALTARQYAELLEDAVHEKTGQFHERYTENAQRTKLSFQPTSKQSGRR